jgi:hypothetical protein
MPFAHHLLALVQLVVRLVEPAPPPRSPLDFARTLQITEGNDAPTPGQAPAHLGDKPHRPQEACLRWALRFWRFVVLAPPQDGKDTGVFVPLVLWSLIEYRRPAVYATSDKHLGAKLFRAKLRAPLVASGYGWALPDDGSGSSGGTPDDILFKTGARYYQLGAGASNGAGQAGITSWLVVITEADKIRPVPLAWIEDRNKSYTDDKRTVLGGTLDRYDGKGLWAEWEYATKGRMWYFCVHCAHPQTFEWAAVTYDPIAHDAPTPDSIGNDTARIICTGCKAALTEADRQTMVAAGVEVFEGQSIENGQVVGTPLPNMTGAMRWTALDSPRRRLANVAAEHRAALQHADRTGDKAKLREFFLKEMVMLPEDRTQALFLREADLAQRSALSIYQRGQVPAGVDLIIVTVDVQLRRLLWKAIGFKVDDESWSTIAYGSEPVCGDSEEPTRAQRFAALDKIEARAIQGWVRSDGFFTKATAGGIDTGDGNTRPAILDWLKGRPGWFAIKGQADRIPAGDSADGEAIFRLPGVVTIHRQTKTAQPHDLFLVNVDSLKARVYRALTYKPGSPGAGQLPQGEAADGQLIRQLCAERQEMTDEGPVWVQRYRHNHYLDCTVYALALFLYFVHLRTLRGPAVGASAADYARRLGAGA